MTPDPGGPRPRDLARLLLALGGDPPRARARDQQADRAGGELRRRVLERVEALDPEPEDLEASLSEVVDALGGPTGPTRAVALGFLREWQEARAVPGYWAWLLEEAVFASGRPAAGRRERGPRSPE